MIFLLICETHMFAQKTHKKVIGVLIKKKKVIQYYDDHTKMVGMGLDESLRLIDTSRSSYALCESIFTRLFMSVTPVGML